MSSNIVRAWWGKKYRVGSAAISQLDETIIGWWLIDKWGHYRLANRHLHGYWSCK